MGWCRSAVTVVLVAVAINYLPKLFQSKLKPVVGGYCHPKFQKVAETFRQNVESGKEEGGAFAVYHRGELLVDMWGGYADPEANRPWASDTMTIAFSSTKGVAAITIAYMVDKGWLDYDKPVAHYWPEFAQNGKEKITVATLISHQAGLMHLDEKISVLDIRDKNEEFTKLLERQKPIWEPGTSLGYHAITYGMYIDILAKKADPKHRNMTQIFQEEIAKPYGIDFYIGLPKSLSYRMARGRYPSLLENLGNSLLAPAAGRLVVNMVFFPESNIARAVSVVDFQPSDYNNPDVVNVGVSSFLGIGGASGLAKLYSYLAAGGTIKGKQLLSAKVLNRLSTPVRTGLDEVLLFPVTIGHGVMFKNSSKGDLLIGHPGYGGQIAFADVTNGVSAAYVTNFASIYSDWDDPRYVDLEKAFYESFAEYVKNKP